MELKERNALEISACHIRQGILRGVFAAKSGHPGGSLSSTDLMAYLYGKEMKHRKEDPKWEGRDRFVLSKGHAAPVLYSTLAHYGYFDVGELDSLRHIGSMLQGHPDMKHIPGVDMSTGSLGQGVSTACGMALAAKLTGADYRVYALLGDGECEEGQVWEAMMFAAHKKLDNLCVIIDSNGLQIDGPVAEVGGPEPLDEKLKAFGLQVIEIDAHSFDAIEAAMDTARSTKGKPTAILARSTKGKGVSFMENQVSWHGKAPNEEQYNQAMTELKAKQAELEKEGARYG